MEPVQSLLSLIFQHPCPAASGITITVKVTLPRLFHILPPPPSFQGKERGGGENAKHVWECDFDCDSDAVTIISTYLSLTVCRRCVTHKNLVYDHTYHEFSIAQWLERQLVNIWKVMGSTPIECLLISFTLFKCPFHLH